MLANRTGNMRARELCLHLWELKELFVKSKGCGTRAERGTMGRKFNATLSSDFPD
jgi:hypothetical protein